jgi:hypothetical protein
MFRWHFMFHTDSSFNGFQDGERRVDSDHKSNKHCCYCCYNITVDHYFLLKKNKDLHREDNCYNEIFNNMNHERQITQTQLQ